MRGVTCAAACLPAGFGLAVATGVRPLGGLLLTALAALAGHWSRRPLAAQARWYAVVLVCFIASHLLGHVIGAWPSVAVVSAVAALTYVALLSRPTQRLFQNLKPG